MRYKIGKTKLSDEEILQLWPNWSVDLLKHQTFSLEILKEKWTDIIRFHIEDVVFRYQIVDKELLKMYSGHNRSWIPYQNIQCSSIPNEMYLCQPNRLFTSGSFANLANKDMWKHMFIRVEDIHRLLDQSVPNYWWQNTIESVNNQCVINKFGASRDEWNALYLHTLGYEYYLTKMEPWPLEIWKRFSTPERYFDHIFATAKVPISFSTVFTFQKFINFETFFEKTKYCSKKMVNCFSTTPKLKKIVKDRVLKFGAMTQEWPEIDNFEPLSMGEQAYKSLPDELLNPEELKNLPVCSFYFVLKMIIKHGCIKFFAAEMFWNEIGKYIGWMYIIKYCFCSEKLIAKILYNFQCIQITEHILKYQIVPEYFIETFSLPLSQYLKTQKISKNLFKKCYDQNSIRRFLISNSRIQIPIFVWKNSFQNESDMKLLAENHIIPTKLFNQIPANVQPILLIYQQFPEEILIQIFDLPLDSNYFNYQELSIETMKKYYFKLSRNYFLYNPHLFSTAHSVCRFFDFPPSKIQFSDIESFVFNRSLTPKDIFTACFIEDYSFVEKYFVPQQHALDLWENHLIDIDFKARVAVDFNLCGSIFAPSDSFILSRMKNVLPK